MSKITTKNALYETTFSSPLGPMLAIGDDKRVYLLEFIGRKELQKEITRLKTKNDIVQKETPLLKTLKNELEHYFAGTLTTFTTPFEQEGTPFQKSVWNGLNKIRSGTTCSYLDVAKAIGKPKAVRAVASAVGANQLALIVPCHRVINTGGLLGGYAAGLERKQWLLNHELNTGRFALKLDNLEEQNGLV